MTTSHYIRVSAKVSDPYTKVGKMRSVVFKSDDGLAGPYGDINMTDTDKGELKAFLDTQSLNGALKEMFVPDTNKRDISVNTPTDVVAYHDEVYATVPVSGTSAIEVGQNYYVYIFLENESGYHLIQPSDVTIV
jgi:hypothetical protein